jgi:hypothetical protein
MTPYDDQLAAANGFQPPHTRRCSRSGLPLCRSGADPEHRCWKTLLTSRSQRPAVKASQKRDARCGSRCLTTSGGKCGPRGQCRFPAGSTRAEPATYLIPSKAPAFAASTNNRQVLALYRTTGPDWSTESRTSTAACEEAASTHAPLETERLAFRHPASSASRFISSILNGLVLCKLDFARMRFVNVEASLQGTAAPWLWMKFSQRVPS